MLSDIHLNYFGILPRISSDILCGIPSDTFSDRLSDIYSDILFGLLPVICSDILSGITLDIYADSLFGIYSGFLLGIPGDKISDISFGILHDIHILTFHLAFYLA